MRWKAAKASGEGGVCRQPETSVLLGALLGNWRGRGLEMARCLGARLAQHFFFWPILGPEIDIETEGSVCEAKGTRETRVSRAKSNK